MQIRSITFGAKADPNEPDDACREAAPFLRAAREAFAAAGFPLQTTRLCTQPAHAFLTPSALPHFAAALDAACAAQGIDYAAAGGIRLDQNWNETATAEAVADSIAQSERVFSSLQLLRDGAIDFGAARAAAKTILAIAGRTPDGFGNLRFAATANCPANTPFFPVAYHDGGSPAFSIALQCADFVVDAFAGDDSLEKAQQRLIARFQEEGGRIEAVAQTLERTWRIRYLGIDLSPAPFPSEAESIGWGLEAMGLDRFGGLGSVAAVFLVTQALRAVQLKRCGFSGVMLPVLEDSVLAGRAAEGLISLQGLLLYSAVCGTGLDCVPLPSDVSEEAIASVLIDLAALALALNKPLTARLLPVPGKRAGDRTDFSFPFFANSRVLSLEESGASSLIQRGVL